MKRIVGIALLLVLAASVQAVAPTNGLVVYWPLDGNANDIVGVQGMTTTNGSPVSTNGVLGVTNTAYYFAGSPDSFQNENDTFQDGDQVGTLSLWYKGTGNVQSMFCRSHASTPNVYFEAVIYNNKFGIQSSLNASGEVWWGTNTVINDGSWHHCVLQSDGTNWFMYVDKMAQGLTGAAGANQGDWFADFASGNRATMGKLLYSGGSSIFLVGTLDNVRIYDRVLSSNEVVDIYNAEGPATARSGFAFLLKTGQVLTDSRIASGGTPPPSYWTDPNSPRTRYEMNTNGTLLSGTWPMVVPLGQYPLGTGIMLNASYTRKPYTNVLGDRNWVMSNAPTCFMLGYSFIARTNYTLTMWAYNSGTISNAGIAETACFMGNNSTHGDSILKYQARWALYDYNTALAYGGFVVPEWTHLTLMRSNTVLSLYTNAYYVCSVTGDATYSVMGSAAGASWNGTSPWNGWYDQLKLYTNLLISQADLLLQVQNTHPTNNLETPVGVDL